jgi:hypothetical protein
MLKGTIQGLANADKKNAFEAELKLGNQALKQARGMLDTVTDGFDFLKSYALNYWNRVGTIDPQAYDYNT